MKDPEIVWAQTYVGDMKLDIDDPTEHFHLYWLDIADEAYPHGCYFVAKHSTVIQAIYFLNRDLILGSFALLNTLYEYLRLPKTEYGERVAWTFDDDIMWADFDILDAVTPDDKPCYKITPLFEPDDEFKEYYYKI